MSSRRLRTCSHMGRASCMSGHLARTSRSASSMGLLSPGTAWLTADRTLTMARPMCAVLYSCGLALHRSCDLGRCFWNERLADTRASVLVRSVHIFTGSIRALPVAFRWRHTHGFFVVSRADNEETTHVHVYLGQTCNSGMGIPRARKFHGNKNQSVGSVANSLCRDESIGRAHHFTATALCQCCKCWDFLPYTRVDLVFLSRQRTIQSGKLKSGGLLQNRLGRWWSFQ